MKQRTLLLLIGIILFGAILRLSHFPFVPPSLNRDEAALGYNAYSILKTGKDEWGVSYPVVFTSFGDYKLPGFIYTLVPFIAVFGRSELAVRLPSLLAGVMLIPLAYVFVKILSKNTCFALCSSFVVAISPWAMHYSSIGFEANVALMVFILSIILLITKTKRVWIPIVGFVLMFVSLMTYNAPLILLPGIFLLLFLSKNISFKKLLLVGVVAICVFVLILPATKGKGRISLYSDPYIASVRRELRVEHAQSIVWRVCTNPIVYYPSLTAQRFVETFLPHFLVTVGGQNPWHQIPGGSHFLWIHYALFVFGALALIVSVKKKFAWIMLGFLIISPLPAMITSDAPHATRSLFTLFLISVIAGYGLSVMYKKVKLLSYVMVFALMISAGLFSREYVRLFTTVPQGEWNVGMKEAILDAENLRTGDETITIAGNVDFDYAYPLFYTGYLNVVRDDVVESFGHYRFVQLKEQIEAPTIAIYREKVDGQDKYRVEKVH